MKLCYDARDDSERMFSSLVFDSYIKANDLSEYNHFLSDISNRYHKSINYLKSLRKVYVDTYASQSDLKVYNEKKSELKSGKNKFSKFCDDLFELSSDEERNYFIISSKITFSELMDYLDKYKRHNCKYCEKVDDFCAQFSLFFKNYKNSENEKSAMENYNKSCLYFNNMIELGFYNLGDYVEHFSDSYDSFYKNYYYASFCRNCIKKYDIDSWYDYEYMMKENKKKSFFILKDKIELFNDKLRNNENVDVIDYYMIVGIPFRRYIRLCEGNISVYDLMRFKKFVSSYLNGCFNSFERYPSGVSPSFVDINEDVVCFLNNNGIPFEFYNCALVKYLSGDLDKYIGKSKKID